MKLGQVEHGERGARCVHRVVRESVTLVEFVTRCDGRTEFGTPATTVAYRGQFRRRRVEISGECARFVSADQVAQRSETPAQREQRRLRDRERAATRLEVNATVETASTWVRDDERETFMQRASAIAAAIRADGLRKHRRAAAALIADVRNLCAVREGQRTRARIEAAAKRRARKPRAPWFVRVLSLSAWPCDRAAVKAAFAALALRCHPDHGGTAAEFIEAKRARDEALAALSEGRAA